ncbi:MAG: hypothetical protein AAF847_06240 [Bacteroidota bacterium]
MSRKLALESRWWIITAFVTLGILFPIITEGQYLFLWPNVFLIVTFITLTRYIFLLQQTFLSRLEWLKALLILAAPIFIFLLVQEVVRFQTYIDQYEWHDVIAGGAAEANPGLAKYIYTEMLFFGVAGSISAATLPFRMVISIWRIRNLGKE